MVQMTGNSVCCSWYLSNHISHNCHLWYTSVKGYKMPQKDKKLCLSHSVPKEPYIIWFSFLVHMYKRIICPGIFFIKIWIVWAIRRVKGQKMVQNYKKLCLLQSMSQETNMICLSLAIPKCKMIIYPSAFLNFSKFWFFGFWGGERGKNSPKWQKFL